MARLDVHARRDGGTGLLLDGLADLLSRLDTRLLVTFVAEAEAPPRRGSIRSSSSASAA